MIPLRPSRPGAEGRLRAWPWLVPALGGATALLLWVAVERRPVVVESRVPAAAAKPSEVALAETIGPEPATDSLARKELDRQLAIRHMTATTAPLSSPRQDADAQAPASPRSGILGRRCRVDPAAPARGRSHDGATSRRAAR